MNHTLELEIFRAGTFPEGTFTPTDLDSMVEAYDPGVHEAPLVLDHAPPGEDHRGPAYGWVEGLQRVGDTLVARITQVPEELKRLVEEGRYKHRSAEVYLDFQGTGSRYLKRIALLGAAIPAVKGLAPIAFAEDGGPSVQVAFEEPLGETEEPAMDAEPRDAVQALIEAEVATVRDELTRRLEEALAAKDEELAAFKERAEHAEAHAAALTERASALVAEAAEREVAAFVAKLASEGKVTPAEAKDLKATLLALPDDAASLVAFSASGGEGEPMTPRARLTQTYEARRAGSAVPLEEVATETGPGADAVRFGEGPRFIRAPKPVVRFYEAHREAFAKMGVSLEAFARSELHHSASGGAA